VNTQAHLHSPAPEEALLVSTGALPTASVVQELVNEAWRRYRSVEDGEIATYIPELARVRADAFGLCIGSVDGTMFSAGEAREAFSIQSVAKPFVFALVCEALGEEEVREIIGVNATGLAFDSVMAIELNRERTMNAMVNAGALATVSLAPGATVEDKWRFIREGLSRIAGRALTLNERVYRSESFVNHRNRGIARLLESYGRLYFDAERTTDIYTRQCALDVNVEDLATMGATLADGGVNPLTGERALRASVCKRVLAALATAGMYERSGDWLYETGLPGKSGVSGGIVTIAPGKGAMGAFAPRLDAAGNSVKGQLAARFLSERLGLNLFASKPAH
jgi:glutaminase